MIKEIEYKLEIISNVYSNYILSYTKCQSSTRFRKDIPAYSFSDIMSYLGDTLEIISKPSKTNGFSSSFAYHISLLQAIYVQQDLVLELLYLVNCKIEKGNLLRDSDYSINRDIRNEIVGHPIRKTTESIENSDKKRTVLLSSVLMDIHSNSQTITYARYHKNNNYKFEKLSFKTKEIISRHYVFLNRYLDLIITRFKAILSSFSKRVSNIRNLIDVKPFEMILNLISLDYESILEIDYCYDKKSLMRIYERKNEKMRYEFFIDTFIKELKEHLDETVCEIPFAFKKREWENDLPIKKLNIKLLHPQEDIVKPVSYHYELGKLATKRNQADFDFFSNHLRSKCKNDELIQSELDHMENNIHDQIEYYTALNVVREKLLNKTAST